MTTEEIEQNIQDRKLINKYVKELKKEIADLQKMLPFENFRKIAKTQANLINFASLNLINKLDNL